MGWFGVVFKADISYRSEFLAIGLTTGYLGSVTTFSGWNQKMLELSVEGHWVFAGLGFLIGKMENFNYYATVDMLIVAASIVFELHRYLVGFLLWAFIELNPKPNQNVAY